MPIDVYDVNHEKTGKRINRGDVLAVGEFQLAACAVIVNEKRQFLITQRHPDKQLGLNWEFPGGAVETTELSRQTVIRELKEEVGISISDKKTIFLQTYCYHPFQLLIDIYLVFMEVKQEALILQKDEIIAAKLVSHNEIKQCHQEGLFTPFDFEISKVVKRELANMEIEANCRD